MTDFQMSPREYCALACNAECLEEQARKTGRMLRKIRRNASLSPREFAAKLEVPVKVVQGWERGELIFTPMDAYRVQGVVGMQVTTVAHDNH